MSGFFLRLVYRLQKRRLLKRKRVLGKRAPRAAPGGVHQHEVFRYVPAAGPGELFLPLGASWTRLAGREHERKKRVLVKVNLNSPDPYPASTCPVSLAAFLDLLRLKGFTDLVVADCSGVKDLPTRKVAEATGLLDAIEGKAKFVPFDEGRWFTVDIPGWYLREAALPEALFESDLVVSFANIKSHSLSDFSFSMKLAVGFLHPSERFALHEDHLQEKCVELSLAVKPDIVIIDGRAAMITGGPCEGETADIPVVLAGRDPFRVDLAAYRELHEARCGSGEPGGLTSDPFRMRQFAHAVAIGLGQAAMPEIVDIGGDSKDEGKKP